MFGSPVLRNTISILEFEALSAINAALIVNCEVLVNLIEPWQYPPIVETFQSLSDFLRSSVERNARLAWVAVEPLCHTYKKARLNLKGV
jgi:hypothetical protein